MSIKIYNSLTNKKEDFKPVEEGKVKMYICGQTVYDNMHIGHGRTYISFDTIRRYLQYKGYDVETVINITDVNDKIDDRAEEEGKSSEEIAEKYTRINLEDFASLGITAEAYPKASDYIEEMKEMVEKLIDRGFAYQSDGNVFFDVKKFEDYGKLSNQKLEDLKSDRDDIMDLESKKDPRDFVLWRSRKDYKGPTWESPWGEGVPGWHIECSAMSSRILGEKIDIHGGGVDLVFPHHEDEIAQCEACNDEKPWVKYWMHSGLVRLEDEKMSKSLGNFVSTRDLLKDHRPEVLRTMVVSTHYRKPLNYSEKLLDQAEKNFKSIENVLNSLEAEINSKDIIPEKLTDKDNELREELFERKKSFEEAMDNDFNTPEALKELLGIVKSANKHLKSGETNLNVLKRFLSVVEELSWVLGVLPYSQKSGVSSDKYLVEKILELRQDAREEGDYELADRIREIVEESGIKIEDTDEGVKWS